MCVYCVDNPLPTVVVDCVCNVDDTVPIILVMLVKLKTLM